MNQRRRGEIEGQVDELTFLYVLSCKRKNIYIYIPNLLHSKKTPPLTQENVPLYKNEKKLFTYENMGIYFTVLASSGKPIDVFLFLFLVWFWFNVFLSERREKRKRKKKEKMSNNNNCCNLTEQERKTQTVCDAMLLSAGGVLALPFSHAAHLAVIYTSGPTTSEQLIVPRNAHAHTHTQGRFRIFSTASCPIFRRNRRKQFLK